MNHSGEWMQVAFSSSKNIQIMEGTAIFHPFPGVDQVQFFWV
jgi:hypothetical protein